MSIEIRGCKDDEFPRFVEVMGSAFGHEVHEKDAERYKKVLEIERAFAGFDDGRLVGTSGSFSFEMTVPGGASIPTAGVTMVGVLPTHRRRGIMRGMMQAVLDDARARGEPAAILWASEESIYQRFGYGLASDQGHMDIERGRTRFLGDPPRQGSMRLVSLKEAREVLPTIYERARSARPGMLARSAEWWPSWTLFDAEHHREGQSGKFVCVFSHDGEDQGYAIYRMGGGWGPDGTPQGWANVREVVATDLVAYRELWRYLFELDLNERIKAWYLPADLPLTLMLEEPRRLRFSKSDSLWLRLVDVTAALEARTYAADGALTFSITDALCPWNEGEWTLVVEGGRGRLEQGGEPEIALDVSALATVYLGGFTFGQLHRALRLDECTDEAIAKADNIFRAGIAPWCAENF